MKNKTLLIVLLSISISAIGQVSIDIPPLSSKADFIKDYPIRTERLYAPDMQAVALQDEQLEAEGKPPRYAVHIPVGISTNSEDNWMELKGGARLWRARLETNGALGTTLLFDEFSIPEGGLVHVYNDDRSHVLGAFTSQNNADGGNYASQILLGSACTIEYYEPANVRGEGLIEIADLGYCYRYVYGIDGPEESRGGGSDWCQVDVNCSEGNNWQDEKNGIVGIGLVLGFGSSWCSGSMVNNTALNCEPYLLTALHCTESSSSSNFGQYTFYYNYESTGCGGGSVTSNQTTVGCVERANSNDGGGNSGSDFSLLEVTGNIPSSYNIYYNGWNAQNVASPSGVGLHHPSGDRMKISTYTSSLQSTQWGSATGSHWRVFWSATTNGHGVTEGGSSGSPIFDNQGRIVGTLTGGSSFCSSPNSPDQYGKMSYHWASNPGDDLRDWLDPANTGQLTLDGTYAPCTPPDTYDAGISDVVSPAGSTCDNTITPVVTLSNFGGNTLTSVTINYNVNGTGTQQFQWTGSLSTNQSENVTLPTLTVGSGQFTFNASTSSPNNQQDDGPSNDGAVSAFSVTIADSYVTLVLNLDDYGEETTWDVVQDGGGVIASGGPYENFENNQIEEEICVATGECYTFTIYDEFGDGICCYTGQQNPSYQDGSYSLANAENISLITGSEFTEEESYQFCVPEEETCVPQYDPVVSNASGFRLYSVQAQNQSGFISGTNSYGDLAKAQEFQAPSQPSEMSGILVWVNVKDDQGGTLTANLYDMDGPGNNEGGTTNSAPGTVLATASKQMARVDTSSGFLTRFDFTNPVAVSSNYAVGMDFSSFNGDVLGIVSNTDGDANGSEQAWEQWDNGDWYTMKSTWSAGNNGVDGDFDLAIFPILCPQTVTGISENNLSFSLYPNPNDGRFVVINSEGIDAAATIYNTLGQEVLTRNLTGLDAVQLDVSDQQSGIYFLKVEAAEGQWTQRFVIK